MRLLGRPRTQHAAARGATEKDIKATYKDGILEVRVPAPKAAEPQPAKKIPIARG